ARLNFKQSTTSSKILKTKQKTMSLQHFQTEQSLQYQKMHQLLLKNQLLILMQSKTLLLKVKM
ncbi:hypothetical protein, partial [Streptococcus suis]|uniref:hypothetical protein n=1 Tax=Streptococcus suis TaxID=1307 RepID=UPI003703B43F